ncbi:MAG TPA: hypothetical protein VK452_02315 [Dissulfurispiraceae bacterium]|nr:hypothetical protein [Dissulfurispiraceae bacterium]
MLLEDRDVNDLLHSLDLCIEATQRAMVDSGMARECADCAISEAGTCCSFRTGYKSDSVILLINLLLGRDLPTTSFDARLCYFLTEIGCVLRARHVICTNFICQRLRDTIPHETLCSVQEIAGNEIDTMFALEEAIKKKLVFNAKLVP